MALGVIEHGAFNHERMATVEGGRRPSSINRWRAPVATQWDIVTSAPKHQLVEIFRQIFFVPPSLVERFQFWTLNASTRSGMRWRPADVPDAVAAAELVQGKSMLFDRLNLDELIGTVAAISASEGRDGTEAHIWLARYNDRIFIRKSTQMVLRKYARLLAKQLRANGQTARVV